MAASHFAGGGNNVWREAFTVHARGLWTPVLNYRQKVNLVVNSRRISWWCWGAFDALLLIDYVFKVIASGRVPFVSDALRIPMVASDEGMATAVLFALRLGLLVSVGISCVLFFAQRNGVKWLVGLQLPVRLLLFIPSVSVLYLYEGYQASAHPLMFFLIVLACELFKIWTLWFFGRRQIVA
jgi:hypothetical protein